MRKYLFLLMVGLVMGLSASVAGAVPNRQENLLRNPGFEGQYSAWQIQYGTAQMAAEWTPWWIEDGSRSPVWAQPEYKPAEAWHVPERVHAGERAQQYFTFFKSHYAGLYQQVFNVTPGTTYRFTVWVQVWSSVSDEVYSDTPANPRLHIGIDPTGAAWPGSTSGTPSTVVWGGEAPMVCVIDQWCPLSIDVQAQNSTITVYMRSSPDFANKHNDFYFDSASLVAVDGSPAPVATNPPPANTSVPATTNETPVPTATLERDSDVVPSSYVVQAGDTLSSIAFRFGVSASDLAEVNGITNASSLSVGQVLVMPGSVTATATTMPTEEATEEPTEVPATFTPVPTIPAPVIEPTAIPTETPEPEPTATAVPATAESTEVAVVATDPPPTDPPPTETPVPVATPEPEVDGVVVPQWALIGGGVLLVGIFLLLLALVVMSRRRS